MRLLEQYTRDRVGVKVMLEDDGSYKLDMTYSYYCKNAWNHTALIDDTGVNAAWFEHPGVSASDEYRRTKVNTQQKVIIAGIRITDIIEGRYLNNNGVLLAINTLRKKINNVRRCE